MKYIRRASFAGWLALWLATELLANSGDIGPALANDIDLGCGPVRPVDVGTFDYRIKDATPEGAKKVWNLDHYHTEPAVREMQKSHPYPGNVTANLDFSLRHSPNHHEALRALIRWELGGGDLLGFPDARCSLDWARKFAPDDSTVFFLGGTYFWKKGDRQRAELWYKQALAIAPQSADTHYNLGLFYVESKQYELAREHARAAYAAGFPLQGLRRKLASAGYTLNSTGP